MAGQPLASKRLHAIAARLRAEGEKGVTRGMNKTFRAAAAPLITSVRAEAAARLPKRGGLNMEQASQPIRVQVLTGSRSAGVRIRTRTPGSMQTDKGYVRHPTPTRVGYHRSYWQWVQQDLPGAAGWWTDTMAHGSTAITPLILAEMDRIGRLIQSGAL